MNAKQKIALSIGGLLILISAIFPTWSIKMAGFELETERRFLYTNSVSIWKEFLKASNIKKIDASLLSYHVSVDYFRMGVEFAIIVLITVGAVFFLKKKEIGK
jgi:hypothetical protein